MDNEYESFNSEFKMVSTRGPTYFMSEDEMKKDMKLMKEDISADEYIGDPERGKAVKKSSVPVTSVGTAKSSTNSVLVSGSGALPDTLESDSGTRASHYDRHQSKQPPENTRVPQNHTQKKQPPPLTPHNYCPVCNEHAVGNCGCSNLDSICRNSHKWHYEAGVKVLGHTH
jgi:hypothetical protein